VVSDDDMEMTYQEFLEGTPVHKESTGRMGQACPRGRDKVPSWASAPQGWLTKHEDHGRLVYNRPPPLHSAATVALLKARNLPILT
jgi:hypothetical protein